MFFYTLGLVISVAATSPHDIHDNPISLSVPNFYTECDTVEKSVFKCVDCLFSFLSGLGDPSRITAVCVCFFFLFSGSDDLRHQWSELQSESCTGMLMAALLLLLPLWWRHVTKVYVCRSHPSNMAFSGQTEPPTVPHVRGREAVFILYSLEQRKCAAALTHTRYN